MTNRTFRYLAGPGSRKASTAIPRGRSRSSTMSASATKATCSPSAFQSVQGFDSFNPQSNFHDPFNVANQNGIVFFPGSTPVYNEVDGGDGSCRQLVGGLGGQR